MKRYAVFAYGSDGASEGEIVAYVEADDPFAACEKAGFPDANTHFARQVEMKKDKEYVAKESERLNKIKEQLQVFVDADNKAQEEFEKDRPCPNCGEKMDKNYTCKKCGYGRDEIAIGGIVITKEMLEEAKKLEKERQKLANQAKKTAKKKKK
jgi:ribosomal protein S27AE